MSKNQKNNIDRLLRLISHFPFDDKEELSALLKGHLLIEELVIEIVNKKVCRSESLVNFKFYQYLSVAKSLESNKKKYWIWESCEKLNSIRNKISHKLEPTDIDKTKSEFIILIDDNDKDYPKPVSSGMEPFSDAIVRLHMAMTHYLNTCRQINENKYNRVAKSF